MPCGVCAMAMDTVLINSRTASKCFSFYRFFNPPTLWSAFRLSLFIYKKDLRGFRNLEGLSVLLFLRLRLWFFGLRRVIHFKTPIS